MTDSETTGPHPSQTGDQTVTTLRGAGVRADGRRIGRLAVAIALVVVVGTAGVLYVVGFQKNAQIADLHRSGVPVEVTVTSCRGQLGGSGSNPVGYSCTGTYRFGGRTYRESIPGDKILPPGGTVRGIVTPGDPSLFSTPGVLAGEQPSWRVYLAPTFLLLVALAVGGDLVLRARRSRTRR